MTTGDARIMLPPVIAKDAVIYVRALISHPMYTGMSRDEQGKLIPTYFIDQVHVTYAGDPVAHFQWTSGISKDPYVAFPLRASREGTLTIEWRDTKGGVYTQSAEVKFTT